jgi:cytochrome c oxidase assembly factor CtaG
MTSAVPVKASRQFSIVSNKYARIMIGSIALTLVLLADPIDAIADQNLTVHMFQHIGVFIFSIVFGYALHKLLVIRLASLKRITSKGWAAFIGVIKFNTKTKGLVFAGLVPSIVFVFWGMPSYFDLAVINGYAHILEHLSYIIAGGLVGLSLSSMPQKYKALLLALGFMSAGMMGSMMLVWPPGFYPVYSAAQNTDMNTAMMLMGALGMVAVGSWLAKILDII